MRLAQGENVIGEWKYADMKTKKGLTSNTTEASITLTNKRIVHDVVDKHSFMRREVQLKDITAIDYYHSKKSNFWVWVKIAFGVLTCPIIIGIFILANAIRQLHAGDFIMEISTSGVLSNALNVGAKKKGAEGFGAAIKAILLFIPNLILGLFGIKLGAPEEVVKKMHVHHDVIMEIIDSLGAAVMDSKAVSVTVEEFDK